MTFIETRGLRPEPTVSAAARAQAFSGAVLEATGGVPVCELLLHRLGSLIDADEVLFLDINVRTTSTERHRNEDIEAIAVTADLVTHVHAHVSSTSASRQRVITELDVRPTNLIDRLVVATEDASPSADHPAFRPELHSVRVLFSDGHSLSVPVSERGRDRIGTALQAFLPTGRRTS